MPRVFSDWGLSGATYLGAQSAVVVVVDVLSFSTCVDMAVARGAQVLPFAFGDPEAAAAAASALGAEIAGRRGSRDHRYSLSPASLASIPAGTLLLLPSPNGSAISSAVAGPFVLAGCLRNARAVAAHAKQLAKGGPLAVIAPDEQWPNGSLRPAIEDVIGAGAIIHELDLACSPEAEIARAIFTYARPNLAVMIQDCLSGRELIERGYPQDVTLAVQLNVSTSAPVLRNGIFSQPA